ncbi:hypothetical protein HDU77_011851 [Chytriomyces hyalinus]|nr:hypothetical protein HDU77_011851 [Chytriomyces hyalinus]
MNNSSHGIAVSLWELQQSVAQMPTCVRACQSLAWGEATPLGADYPSLLVALTACASLDATAAATAACVQTQCANPFNPSNDIAPQCRSLLAAAFGPAAAAPSQAYLSGFATTPRCAAQCLTRPLPPPQLFTPLAVCTLTDSQAYSQAVSACLDASPCSENQSNQARFLLAQLATPQVCIAAMAAAAATNPLASIVNAISLIDALNPTTNSTQSCSKCVAKTINATQITTGSVADFCAQQSLLYPAVTECIHSSACTNGTDYPVLILGKCYADLSSRSPRSDPIAQIHASLKSMPPCAQSCIKKHVSEINDYPTSLIIDTCKRDSFHAFANCASADCVSADILKSSSWGHFIDALTGNFDAHCRVLSALASTSTSTVTASKAAATELPTRTSAPSAFSTVDSDLETDSYTIISKIVASSSQGLPASPTAASSFSLDPRVFSPGDETLIS